MSALTYHFGSREGLLEAILIQHGDPTDVAAGEHLARIGRDAPTRDLVDALVVPYAAHLATPAGRDYLRIVAQLAPLFSTWREATRAPGHTCWRSSASWSSGPSNCRWPSGGSGWSR